MNKPLEAARMVVEGRVIAPVLLGAGCSVAPRALVGDRSRERDHR